jgi:hypothetical protein
MPEKNKELHEKPVPVSKSTAKIFIQLRKNKMWCSPRVNFGTFVIYDISILMIFLLG